MPSPAATSQVGAVRGELRPLRGNRRVFDRRWLARRSFRGRQHPGVHRSLFMLEVYDRVVPSKSLPTLIALLILAAGLYAFAGFLYIVRGRILSKDCRDHRPVAFATCPCGHRRRLAEDEDQRRRLEAGPGDGSDPELSEWRGGARRRFSTCLGCQSTSQSASSCIL